MYSLLLEIENVFKDFKMRNLLWERTKVWRWYHSVQACFFLRCEPKHNIHSKELKMFAFQVCKLWSSEPCSNRTVCCLPQLQVTEVDFVVLFDGYRLHLLISPVKPSLSTQTQTQSNHLQLHSAKKYIYTLDLNAKSLCHINKNLKIKSAASVHWEEHICSSEPHKQQVFSCRHTHSSLLSVTQFVHNPSVTDNPM